MGGGRAAGQDRRQVGHKLFEYYRSSIPAGKDAPLMICWSSGGMEGAYERAGDVLLQERAGKGGRETEIAENRSSGEMETRGVRVHLELIGGERSLLEMGVPP